MNGETRRVLPGCLSSADAQDLWVLLCEVDDEFVPKLSSRDSTTTKRLQDAASPSGPVTYHRQMLQQWTILADLDGRLAGFISFIAHHSEGAIEPHVPCSYVSTVAVAGEHRRRRIAQQLYAELLEWARELGDDHVATRTWSTNESHLKLLRQLGFSETARIEDHRGPGVDTVYLARPVGATSPPE